MPKITETIMRTARHLLEQGKFAQAAALLQQLIEARPCCAPALHLLGLVYFEQGDLRGAVRLLRQACVIEPENGILRVHLARTESKIGMPAQAAASYEQAIACGCACVDMRVDYALALHAMKQYPAALFQCEQAVAEDPFHARAWSTMGKLLHVQKHLDAALECHCLAIALAPNAGAWSAKALTLDALHRLPEALNCHNEALLCDPADAAAWTCKGVTLAKMGLRQQALECHVEACRLDAGFANAWSNLGAVLSSCKRDDEALAAHDRAISLQPSCGAWWLQRGKALRRAKREAEALASVNAAIHLDPACALAWYQRSLLLRAAGRLQEALDSLDETILLDPSAISAVAVRNDVLRQSAMPALREQIVPAMPGPDKARPDKGSGQMTQGAFMGSGNTSLPLPEAHCRTGTDADKQSSARCAGAQYTGVA